MRHKDLVELVKESGDYCDDIEHGMMGEFIGFVYVRNYKFESKEMQFQFAIPLQSEANQ